MNNGYSKVNCPTCNGRGMVIPKEECTDEPKPTVEMKKCKQCDGQGEITISPYVRK